MIGKELAILEYAIHSSDGFGLGGYQHLGMELRVSETGGAEEAARMPALEVKTGRDVAGKPIM